MSPYINLERKIYSNGKRRHHCYTCLVSLYEKLTYWSVIAEIAQVTTSMATVTSIFNSGIFVNYAHIHKA